MKAIVLEKPEHFSTVNIEEPGKPGAGEALVTALRETSIVFALLIGALVLRERVDLGRIASVFVTLRGVAAMRLAR